MFLENPPGCLLDSISHMHWCGPWIGTWKFLWHFNWVPSLQFIWLGTWHTNWHDYETFTYQLYGQVSWGISRIAFVHFFFNSPLRDLFDSDSWSNFLQLIVYIPLGSKVRYSDLVGSSSWDTLVVPPSGYGLRFHLLPSGACPDFPSQANLAMTFSGFSPTLPRWLRRS